MTEFYIFMRGIAMFIIRIIGYTVGKSYKERSYEYVLF